MSQIIPGWYDTPGAMEILNVSRVAISKIAKREGWQSVPVANGNGHLHNAEDVLVYRDHKIRTRLVEKLGWSGRGLYRVEDIDISCPTCEGFAVEWPPPPELATRWLCDDDGHSGSIDENGDFAISPTDEV